MKLKRSVYSDASMVRKDRRWLLTHYAIDEPVREPMPAAVAASAKKGNRTISVHFARFGSPMSMFLFGSLADNMKGIWTTS